jgi:uroporphyrinogen III methyltransferase/synthase
MSMKAIQALSEADVVVYDALIGLEALALIPPGAQAINVGKRAARHTMPQEEISLLLLEKAAEGLSVVRLKGGDPFLFGRGGEELELLSERGVPFEVVPGIPSPLAAAAYAGIPLTHRAHASSVHFVAARTKEGVNEIDFAALAKMGGTIVFMMGLGSLGLLMGRLLAAGVSGGMPAAAVASATTARQRKVVATVSTLEEKARQEGIQAPALIIVGSVCALAEKFSWREGLPLFGLRVVVTRAAEKTAGLASRLRRLGAEAVEIPSIAHEALSASDSVFRSAADCDWIAFSSPHAVGAFFEKLRELQMDIRTVRASFAAVGPATAEALESHAAFARFTAAPSNAEALAKGLLERIGPGQTILCPRSAAGSEGLVPLLRQGGADVLDAPIYTSVAAAANAAAELALEAGVDAALFASASAVRGFASMCGRESFAGIRAVCIGAACANEAAALGFDATVPKEASIDSMIEELIQLNKEREASYGLGQ